MTHAEYLAALKRLDLSPHAIVTAKALGAKRRTIQRYAEGARDIPDCIALLLEMYLMHGVPGRFTTNQPRKKS